MSVPGPKKNGGGAARLSSETVFRLAKPVKKGILRLVFSRFLLIVLLLLLQVALAVGFYTWLSQHYSWVTTVLKAFTVVMVVYLFNSSMDASARLTWMLIIAVAPLPGAALLWFTQTNAGHRRIRRRVAELTEETRNSLPQSEEVLAALEADRGGMEDSPIWIE